MKYREFIEQKKTQLRKMWHSLFLQNSLQLLILNQCQLNFIIENSEENVTLRNYSRIIYGSEKYLISIRLFISFYARL